LTTIVRQIGELPTTLDIAVRLLDAAGQALHVAPLVQAVRPPLVAALALQHTAPLLYVVSSSETALRAYADLALWLGPEAVLLYPAADALPYEHIAPSMDVTSRRLRTLARLTTTEIRPEPLVVVATVRALSQSTLSPSEWHEAALNLTQSQQLSPDALLAHLIRIGYRVAPTVEEPGELNRRGGIVDVFPTGADLPIRIEFFGDEIDSLRSFDPISQRSQARIQQVTLGPPYDIPFWKRSEASLRAQALDLSGLRPEVYAEWRAALEHLEQGERFEDRTFYAPFFRDPTRQATLLDHLPKTAPIILSELTLLGQHAVELEQQADEQRQARIATGELPADFPRNYLLWNELLERMQSHTRVNLSNNEALPATNGHSTMAPTGFSAIAAPEVVPTGLFGGQLRRLVDEISGRLNEHEHVVVVTPQAARLQELVQERWDGRTAPENGVFTAIHGTLDQGFRLPDMALSLYTDAEIFGWRERRQVSERRRRADKSMEERAAFLRGLKPGDHVVHIEHGIAVFDGMVRRTVGNIEREYLNLRYADGDRLYVPVDQVDRLSRYIGSGDAVPPLTRLGTQEWERTKRKVRAAVQELANELIDLYARRQTSVGHMFSPDGEWQRELEASFPYSETEDQLRAITAVKEDMERPQPMDRLICGDVGFGKTEVALRAAFKAVQDGTQVAVLVPTTVLAQQHFETFSRRMAAFPVRVEMISRFRSNKEQDEIAKRLGRGEVDIIIGTHRLLSKDIHFKNLGLLIVDEEQRFGVRHKERLKQLRANVDVLTLTATPIPRTLHMALAGIRDLSVIDTPPQDRLPIKTYLLPYEDRTVREAILREIDRGGQVFFLHNRVSSIYYVADRLKQLVPEAEVVVGHGQMDEKELEQVMVDFFNGNADVLVSTTIIENGLDVPNANTIIIDDATHYGLAQLYQLRGRVGRSTQRAYAYMFYPADRRMTSESQERLLAIQEATELGAGLRIAMRDLEMRGAGNLLGAEQSGNIAAVGFDLYSRLLQQAVKTLKAQYDAINAADATVTPPTSQPMSPNTAAHDANGKPTKPSRPLAPLKVDEKVLVSPLVTLDLPLDAYLPTDYVVDDRVRLEVYQRLAVAQTPAQVRDLRQELRDRFGELPQPAEHLLVWLMLKALALQAGVPSIITIDEEFIVRLPPLLPTGHDKLRRQFLRDLAVKVGPQFIRLDRRTVNFQGGMQWIEKMYQVLEAVHGALTDPSPFVPEPPRPSPPKNSPQVRKKT
jgi:transcription-repair coupling factor (superfamily II helicase)